MVTKEATIGAAEGLHARPAADFVAAVRKTGLAVKISRGGQDPVSANSILGVLRLGAKQGHLVTLSAEGEDAEAKLGELVRVLEDAE